MPVRDKTSFTLATRIPHKRALSLPLICNTVRVSILRAVFLCRHYTTFMTKLKDKALWLVRKGYDLKDKTPEFIGNLYAIYHPRQNPKAAKGWKQWEQTNRLHHYR